MPSIIFGDLPLSSIEAISNFQQSNSFLSYHLVRSHDPIPKSCSHANYYPKLSCWTIVTFFFFFFVLFLFQYALE